MLNRVIVRVVLAAVVAGLLVAGVVGLTTVGGHGTAISASRSPSSMNAPAPGTGPGTAPGPDAGTAPGQAGGSSSTRPASPQTGPGASNRGPGATAVPPGRPGTGAPVVPGPTRAPATGTYTYDTSTTEGSPPTTSVRQDSATVRAAGDENGVIRQQVGQPLAGVPTTNTVVWASSGVTVEHTTISFAGVTVECQWGTPFTQYGANLHVGSSWSVDATCTGRTDIAQCGGAVGFTVHQTSLANVTGAEVLVVGGVAAPVWDIVRSSFTVDVTAASEGLVRTCAITLRSSVQEREQFAADRGLSVTRDDQGTTTSTFNGQPFPTTNAHAVEALRSLTPS